MTSRKCRQLVGVSAVLSCPILRRRNTRFPALGKMRLCQISMGSSFTWVCSSSRRGRGRGALFERLIRLSQDESSSGSRALRREKPSQREENPPSLTLGTDRDI